MSQKTTFIRIYTKGQFVPGMPFMGEIMTCVMCGKQQKSDPKVESQWRFIEIDDMAAHACPLEFPPDKTGTKEQFAKAYAKVIRKIIRLSKNQN